MPKKTKTQPSQPIQTEDKILDLENRLKRAVADYQNLEKRISSEKDSFIKFANASLLSSLLPSVDTLERAAAHSSDPGVKMSLDQLKNALKDEGLEEISPTEGEEFNHELHDCIETVDQIGKNGIASVVQTGYRFKDGPVLRPAKVKVYSQISDPNQLKN